MTAAIVLAGGRSSRLGRPKEDVVIGGRTLLERTVDACGGLDVVVVGPEAQGGPVGALAAGLERVDAAEVLLLACDMPRVDELVAALPPIPARADAVVAVDRRRRQPLAGRYRVAALVGLEPGTSMRALLDRLTVVEVAVPEGCTDDVDTPADLDRLGSPA